jgi:molybdopterin adenylyltransferase
MKIGRVTISDRASAGVYADRSGPEIERLLREQFGDATQFVVAVIPDEREQISARLRELADRERCDLIVTTGGTGIGPRDVTPEATRTVIDREAPGLAEAMRAASLAITPHAMLSRAIAGMRGTTLIVNLPGSPKAAVENLRTILPVLPHAIELLRDDPGAEAHH